MGVAGKKLGKDARAIGGGLVLGMGVGLFLLNQSGLFFVGSLIAGLGPGLLIASILSKIG